MLAGCGSALKAPLTTGPTVLPARAFGLADFKPVDADRCRSDGAGLLHDPHPLGNAAHRVQECCEPHAGVDLIIVRSDDSHVQYVDADAIPAGRSASPSSFPTPGRYRIVVDAYPKVTGPTTPFNFQLFKWVTVRGQLPARSRFPPTARPRSSTATASPIQGHPHLKAIEPTFLVVHVTDPAGHKAHFTTWRGALAHAIFFHQGSLAYSHTHVCKPGAVYCFSALGNVRVTGHSTAPGILKVGVLLPEAGTWRMFLLTYHARPCPHRPLHPPRDDERRKRLRSSFSWPRSRALACGVTAALDAIDVLRSVLGG